MEFSLSLIVTLSVTSLCYEHRVAPQQLGVNWWIGFITFFCIFIVVILISCSFSLYLLRFVSSRLVEVKFRVLNQLTNNCLRSLMRTQIRTSKWAAHNDGHTDVRIYPNRKSMLARSCSVNLNCNTWFGNRITESRSQCWCITNSLFFLGSWDSVYWIIW